MPVPDFAERFVTRFPHLRGQRILVALSGGSDSVALLHLLRDPVLGLELEVAHVHHRVRGAEADSDAAFCDGLCRGLQLPLHLVYLDPEHPRPDGREAAWRRLRYRALLKLKSDLRMAAVATGHHRDDVAEGVLLQLLRGAGPRAMAGIAAETADGVVRPLLDWRRDELRQWLELRHIRWREDSSNLELGHLRNRVRHVILPDLRTISPQIEDHLVALARSLAIDELHFVHELQRAALWIDPWRADGGVSIASVRDLAEPLRSRWLHAQAARIGIARVSRRHQALFEQLLLHGTPRAVTLGGRWRLRVARSRLWLEPPSPPPPFALDLEAGVTARLPIPGWSICVGRAAGPGEAATWHRWLPDGGRLSVRSAAADDQIEHRGDVVKVSNLLSKHLPRHLRRAWPVLCESDTIAWIPGIWHGPATGDLLVEVMIDGGPAGGLHR
jgi:tRNA(Ile)-lysidine synthetase-like protein